MRALAVLRLGAYDMNAAFMQLKRHERGNHIV
jgi:hypothetical protein